MSVYFYPWINCASMNPSTPLRINKTIKINHCFDLKIRCANGTDEFSCTQTLYIPTLLNPSLISLRFAGKLRSLCGSQPAHSLTLQTAQWLGRLNIQCSHMCPSNNSSEKFLGFYLIQAVKSYDVNSFDRIQIGLAIPSLLHENRKFWLEKVILSSRS